jgi:hypothetical protein
MFDLKELRIRLECHLDILQHADYPRDAEDMPNPLWMSLIDAIDLLKIIEAGDRRTVDEVVKAWQTRYDKGEAALKTVMRTRNDKQH